ncbi:sensor histidine kinase [Helcobacillus massiliensis]|uniref:sensor histidine kinase n=1 Tax=Helcobacillus massiliensis TaxID=521392 RepID=UPI00255248F3|nr:histidine kinase [Helcobacillus massiliensis]MDK7742337.1 histidine kinase [Helcobacillus massiliensis]WOO92027.1 histidine kinase [Helcobacillus massiliensis]
MTRPESTADPTRALPLLQAGALFCYLLGVMQFANPDALEDPSAPVFTAASAPIATGIALIVASVGLLWVLRRSLTSRRIRSALAILVFALLAAGALLGHLGLYAPALILSTLLLVLDASWRISLAAVAIDAAISIAAGPLLFGAPVLHAVLNVLPVAMVYALGTILGVILARYATLVEEERRAVAQRDRALQELARRSVAERDLMLAEERARAAAELHDGLGHRLTLIGMSLEFAQRMRDRAPEAAWQEIATARTTASDAMGEMRTWVRALSPIRRDGSHGIAAVEDAVASFERTGLTVTLTEGLAGAALTEPMERLSLRTVQEGLTNALRHARADHVTIDIHHDRAEGTVTVTVQNPAADAPVGLLPAEHRGIGLTGLTRAARILGGTLTADARPAGEGAGRVFRLTVTVPAGEALATTEGAPA